jgi:hypothetical protein
VTFQAAVIMVNFDQLKQNFKELNAGQKAFVSSIVFIILLLFLPYISFNIFSSKTVKFQIINKNNSQDGKNKDRSSTSSQGRAEERKLNEQKLPQKSYDLESSPQLDKEQATIDSEDSNEDSFDMDTPSHYEKEYTNKSSLNNPRKPSGNSIEQQKEKKETVSQGANELSKIEDILNQK